MDRYTAEDNAVYETDRKYYTMIPNILFDIGMSMQTIRLYCELKRVAGEKGKCWMSTVTLAEKCNMSTGSVSVSKHELEDNGFIKIKNVKCDKGFYHEIEIVDIWMRNINHFTSVSPHEKDTFSPHEKVRSLGELKKNTVNNNQVITPTISQDKLQDQNTLLGKENELMRTTDEIKKSTEDALFRSFAGQQIDYAQFPERIRPVVGKMVKLWHFKAPERTKKGGQYAFWIESCDEILDSCAEFGVSLLDKLHEDWYLYMESHGGCAPYTVSSPKSLVSAVLAKAALMRGNNPVPLWYTNQKPVAQSRLDV